MKIFISGMPKVGKTTLCRKIFENFKDKIKISGFLTEEKNENNKRVGFEIVLLPSEKRFLFASKEKISNISYAGYYLNLSILEKIIEKVEKEIENSDLIIIDEIGKMEMKSYKFKSFIEKILELEINLIATLHREFISNFKNFEIIWLKRENFDEVYEKIIKKLWAGSLVVKRPADNREIGSSNLPRPMGP